jgi:N-acetylneuraminic acid mutarotase
MSAPTIPTQRAWRGISFLLLVIGGVAAVPRALAATEGPDPRPSRRLSIEERVDAQLRLEAVRQVRRIWPADNPQPRPSFDRVASEEAIRARVLADLDRSDELERLRGAPFSEEELDAELVRMRRNSRDPAGLDDLMAALRGDRLLLQECLARPAIVGRNGFRPGELGMLESAVASVEPDSSRRVGPDPSPDLSGCGEWSPMTPLPEARDAHTAVWTGSEMIVFGGNETGVGSTNTGGRYDPATESWTPLPVGPTTPSPREGHTAVWTGSEMIVWGGFRVGGELRNTGGRFDPTSGVWTSTAVTAETPSARWGHTAVWTGSEMIVWGGVDSSETQTGARYSPGTDSWTPTSTGASTPASRYQHTAVWTGSKMIVWGGSVGGSRTNTGGSYDPGSNGWTPTTTSGAPLARTGHTAVWTGQLMIVFGGSVGSTTNTGARYNPETDSWLATSTSGAVARSDHGAVWSGTEMLVAGGNVLVGARYYPKTNSWTPMSSVGTPSYRSAHSTVWTGSEMIVWGGDSGSRLNSGGRYSPATDSWASTDPGGYVPEGRQDFPAVWTGAELIVFGGATSGSLWMNSGGRYDPASDSWAPTSTGPNVPSPRRFHSMVWTGSRVVVWGGEVAGATTNTGGRYDPVSDVWLPTSTSGSVPSARDRHTAVWTGSSMIVWGGIGSSPYALNSGGRYDPVADSWMATSGGGPTGRYRHTAVWTGSEMIVWGGYDDMSGYVGSGGRYDPGGNSWASVASVGAPSPRGLHSAVWTGSEMIVWGGFRWPTPQADGGRYNPVADSWAPMPSTGAVPSPRFNHAGVWTGNEMIIWGGETMSPYAALRTGGRYFPGRESWAATPLAGAPLAMPGAPAIWDGSRLLLWGGGGRVGGRYAPIDCEAASAPVLSGNNTAVGSTGCADTGVAVQWTVPTEWGDSCGDGRAVRVLRDGVPLSYGGCSNLPEGTTSCSDETGLNGVVYNYSVSFWNSCGFGATTAGNSAFDSGQPTPMVQGSGSQWCPIDVARLSTETYATYQWREGAIDLPGATSRAYDARISGEYGVRVATPDGCTGSSSGDFVSIDGCNEGCGAGFADEQGWNTTGWAPEPDNDSGFSIESETGAFVPRFLSTSTPRWYHASFAKPLAAPISLDQGFAFEVGMKSLDDAAGASGSISAELVDAAGNVAASLRWSDDDCCVPSGSIEIRAEGVPIVAETPGASPTIIDTLVVKRNGNVWSAIRNGNPVGNVVVAASVVPTNLRLRFSRPPDPAATRSMSVDFLTVGGPPKVGNSLRLRDAGANAVVASWNPAVGADSYAVVADEEPGGAFATALAEGLTDPWVFLSAPPPLPTYFRVRAKNLCGTGP